MSMSQPASTNTSASADRHRTPWPARPPRRSRRHQSAKRRAARPWPAPAGRVRMRCRRCSPSGSPGVPRRRARAQACQCRMTPSRSTITPSHALGRSRPPSGRRLGHRLGEGSVAGAGRLVRADLLGHPGEQAVDEAARAVGGEPGRQVDGLGQHHGGRHIGPGRAARPCPCAARRGRGPAMRSSVHPSAKRSSSASIRAGARRPPTPSTAANASGGTGSSASTAAPVDALRLGLVEQVRAPAPERPGALRATSALTPG